MDVFWGWNSPSLLNSFREAYLLVNSRGLRLWLAAVLQSVLQFVAESVHFSSIPSHLTFKLCSFPNTVIVLLAVWCCWPKTLSLFYHCIHSISEMPTIKKWKKLFLPPAVAVCLYNKVLLSCFVVYCAMRLCCRTWPVSTLSGSIDWQLWCCMKSRFDWWAGVWPVVRCESVGSMGDLCYWMELTLNWLTMDL